MRLLLDTHIWLWSLVAPTRLSRQVARALQHRARELWLSSVSVWELVVLVERGRMLLDRGVDAWVAEAFRVAPVHEAPLTHDIALASREIALPHRDPADRLIAATARVLSLTLVTADERLIANRGGLSILANR